MDFSWGLKMLSPRLRVFRCLSSNDPWKYADLFFNLKQFPWLFQEHKTWALPHVKMAQRTRCERIRTPLRPPKGGLKRSVKNVKTCTCISKIMYIGYLSYPDINIAPFKVASQTQTQPWLKYTAVSHVFRVFSSAYLLLPFLSLSQESYYSIVLRSKLTAPQNLMSFSQIRYIYQVTHILGLSGVVALTLPIASADRGSRPVYYLPCSDLRQVVNLSLSVA